MTIPQASLLAFAVWTILIPLGAVGFYRWSLILTGKAAINAFSATLPTGVDWYQRAMRAHANCVENLPVFGALVFLLTVVRAHAPSVDVLALTVIGARLAQSTVHMSFVQTSRVVAVRFSCFFVQLLCMVALAVEVVLAVRRVVAAGQ